MSVVQPGITLLEASAGTGKTFRIAHTFLRLVADDGLDPRRIVVVTFTSAASAELRHRIRSRLRDARTALAGGSAADEVLQDCLSGLDDPALANRRLRTALNEFDEVSISTIHAFCQRVLRRHAFESGASFRAELGDAQSLLDDLVADFWARLTWGAEPAMLPALQTGGVTRRLLTDLARKARDPDVPVIPQVAPTPAPDVSAWREQHTTLRREWRSQVVQDVLKRADMVARKTKAHPVSFPPGGTRDRANDVRYRLGKLSPTDTLHDCITFFRADRLAQGTLSGDPPSHSALTALEAFCLAHDALQQPMVAYIQSIEHLLVREVRERLPAQLRARGLRTYDDQLRDLRDALRDDERRAPLLAALRANLDLALVDEFQDTDPVQWHIFRTVFDRRLMLIGDPKQAIYGFRGADVHTYARAARSVAERHTLDVNFRSDQPLVEAINHIFGRPGLVRPFGADEPRFPVVTASHQGSRRVADDRPALELRFMPRSPSESSYKGILRRGWLDDHLPDQVASDVVAELSRGTRVRTSSGDRALTPGDCAVLVRSNAQASAVARALRSRGVPAVRRSDDSVWDGEVAGELVQVLSAVLEPGSLGLRRAALLTPLLGRTGTDLVALDRDDLAAGAVSEAFHRWHSLWRDEGFATMLQAWMDDEAVLERALRGPDGQRRAADLLHLAHLLHEASRSDGLGPTALLSWLRRDGAGCDPDLGTLRLATDEPAVQVVTMHSAKGLEYPFVWCPYLWSGGFVTKADEAHLVFHDPEADDRRTLDIGSDEKARHLEQRKQEQLQEDLRLVYVALTRARHRCVVYWGAAAYSSALGYLLHQKPGDDADDLYAHVTHLIKYKRDADLLTDLEPVLDHPHIGLTHVRWTHIRHDRWELEEARPELRARTLTRETAPDRLWRRSSFTALLRGVDHHDPRGHVDHDEAVGDQIEGTDGEGRIPLADLPGGARMGTFLHEVFEHHDFTRPDELRPLLTTRLPSMGLEPEWLDVLEPALLDVLRTPVGGLRLETVPRERRLDELEFAFPLRGGLDALDPLTVRVLARAFRHPDAPAGFADRLEQLVFVPTRGFMVGSIDLVFEHDGRFSLADYKSNFLGETWADYAPGRLEHHMGVARYQLQAHLYAVALHRFLRWRLPDYRWDDHFGSVHYLFVRGMGPGHDTGVYTCRPTAAFVQHLDDVLAGVAS